MRILVAPLDWGLGHATRCLPVIDALRSRGADVILGCAGRAGALLRAERPELPYVDLPAYAVRYHASRMTRSIASQLPRLLLCMRRENLLLGGLAKRHGIRGVISDNRYGLAHPRVPSVLITHQLHPRLPVPVFGGLAQAVLGRLIRSFHACWVPDHPGPENLAGELSHPPRHPNTSYVGPLTRLSPPPAASSFTHDILCLLSGPEPQRSRLEDILVRQLAASGRRVLLVQGKPEEDARFEREGISICSHLPAGALGRAMAQSRVVISRPGYSTIMDLTAVRRPAIFIPTPGQTEQEYLADRFFLAGRFYREKQSGFSLERALAAQGAFPGFGGADPFPAGRGSLGETMDAWLETLSERVS